MPGARHRAVALTALPLAAALTWAPPRPASAEPAGGPLTERPGDPARGRAIAADRRVGLCLLCHPAPIPEERFQGDLAPDLAGVGSRLDENTLRQRLIDSRRLQPDSIMPAYFRADGFERVARERAGRTLLDAQQLEDVVAWLRTLR